MIKLFFDFVFPPFCLSCKERCATRYLCPACWELCAPPDPAERCRLCFGELDQKGDFCVRCRRDPSLPCQRAYVFNREAPLRHLRMDAKDALAGFALNQWVQLEWPIPDAIVPMPDAVSEAVAKRFAIWLERPWIRAVKNGWERLELCDRELEEGRELLLIDASELGPKAEEAAALLSETFPKRMHVLSLFACSTPSSSFF